MNMTAYQPLSPLGRDERECLIQEEGIEEADQNLLDRDQISARDPMKPWRFYRVNVFPRRSSCWRLPVRLCLLLLFFLSLVSGFFIIFSLLLAIFKPVYTSPPSHYTALRYRVESSQDPGRGNVDGQKIFIAANIIDADLVRGAWGQSLLDLVHLLGPEHVFVSIYENDSGADIIAALHDLRTRLPCNASVVTGAHIDQDQLDHVLMPDGELRITRIAWLAEVRNRALRPLSVPEDRPASYFEDEGFRLVPDGIVFDRLLFLNDVYFKPVDALQLLFSTNQDPHGKAQYQAACAIDFWNSASFYDSYATRDFEGRGLGWGAGHTFFPWFAPGRSQSQALAGQDAVAVQSCWGGMVAFAAHWFQGTSNDSSATGDEHKPLRFRAERELYWSASECCLIHADLSMKYRLANPDVADYGIFMNPFVRTAYEPEVFNRLWTSGRYEHGLAPLQIVMTQLTNNYPRPQERREEIPGTEVSHRVWNQIEGRYELKQTWARVGGFCGRRSAALLRHDMLAAKERGEKYYEEMSVPSH